MEEKNIDKNKIFDWLLHEDSLFINRCNFFLLGQSIIILAYFADSENYMKTILIYFGLIISILWLIISHTQLKYTISKLKQVLWNDNANTYNVLRRKNVISCHRIQGVYIPILLILFWVFVFIFNIIIK